jgi:type I restriction enzyme R subunit
MNSKFDKYLKALEIGDNELIEQTLKELHGTFATLTQDEQKYAQLFLNDINSGNISLTQGKKLKDYIASYQVNAKNNQIEKCVTVFGLDKQKLIEILNRNVNLDSINEFGRFDELKNTVDFQKARLYFESVEKKKLTLPQVNIKIDYFLRIFIYEGGFEIN